MSAPLFSLRDLQIGFRRDGIITPAVTSLSLDIMPGETVALVGESGSGKSVSALASLGLLADNAVQAGDISWKGMPINPRDEGFMQGIRGNQIGMVFQEPMTSLNPLHTIERQIGESLRLHQRLLPAQVRERTIELLARVGIPNPQGRMTSYPHELSGGQRQRVMIAMALANGPDLLIADEPTTALDVTIEAQILDLLADLKRDSGLSMLFITHDLGVVRQIADRVFVMRQGQLVESGQATDIFATPRATYTKDLIAAQPQGIRPAQDSDAGDVLVARDIKVHFPVRGGLLRRTRNWIKAVDGVDLEVRAGRTVGIVGESGSGKSTLARAITQLVTYQGRITLDDGDISQRDRKGLHAFRRQV
ncbi:MAG: ATP-binding cassette domain-containing protein, partial [Candidatus Puniceispirillaceae bacterium]